MKDSEEFYEVCKKLDEKSDEFEREVEYERNSTTLIIKTLSVVVYRLTARIIVCLTKIMIKLEKLEDEVGRKQSNIGGPR